MHRNDVLFLCQFFYPEHNSSATLPWDTAKYLADTGMTVKVMCGYPKEYTDRKNLPVNETVENVEIKRLRYIQLSRGKKLSRLINYLSFTIAALLHIAELRKYKCVIVYSNPPILPFAAVLGDVFFHTKIIFVSYDVYPEVAYASGQLVKGDVIDRVMCLINKKLMQHVSAVIALTDEMKTFLLKNRKGITKENIKVISNWAHESSVGLTQEALHRFGYKEDDFVVSYFGNMGICQDMETLLSAMELLKDCERIKFLVIGHGGKMEEVRNRAGGLKNVQILQYLTGKDFEQAVSISSCSIISLIPGLIGMCAPSKYYSYLQGGMPVIAVVEQGSYLAEEVEKEAVGKAVVPGDSKGLSKAICELASDEQLLRSMSDRARKLYRSKYTKDIGVEKYRSLVNIILGA